MGRIQEDTMARFAATATVSSKGQVTLPKPIRSALGVSSGTKLGFTMVGDEMRIKKIEADGHHDPALDAFLEFLSKDIANGNLRADLPADVAAYARTRDLSKIDVKEVIEGDVAL